MTIDNALPDSSPEALSEHAGELFKAGSAADALFRMYDVLWNETIANLEVDESIEPDMESVGYIPRCSIVRFCADINRLNRRHG